MWKCAHWRCYGYVCQDANREIPPHSSKPKWLNGIKPGAWVMSLRTLYRVWESSDQFPAVPSDFASSWEPGSRPNFDLESFIIQMKDQNGPFRVLQRKKMPHKHAIWNGPEYVPEYFGFVLLSANHYRQSSSWPRFRCHSEGYVPGSLYGLRLMKMLTWSPYNGWESDWAEKS